MPINIKKRSDRRVREVLPEQQDKRLHTLPQWVQKRLLQQENEIRTLKELLEEVRTGQEETSLSYIDVRQLAMKRDTPFYLPRHVLQVTALANGPAPIDMRIVTEGDRQIVSISTSGLAHALQVLPRAANMIYVMGYNR